jgi:hypothetical protein
MTGVHRAAKATVDLVAIGMVRDVDRANDPLVDQVLHLRVVAGVRHQRAAAVEVESRIADVDPVRVAGLARCRRHRWCAASRASRTAPSREPKAACAFTIVSCRERERILEDRCGFLLEPLDEKPHRDLRRNLAAGVSAHAVGHDEKQRVAAVG